jgi:caa(3)-type oxidase subunit IV
MENTATRSATAEVQADVTATPEPTHPDPVQYVRVAVALAVVIGLEVTVYYLGPPKALLIAVLLGLVCIKVSIAVAYFMHLKFDAHLLRRVFGTGIVLALVVYAIALSSLLFHHRH